MNTKTVRADELNAGNTTIAHVLGKEIRKTVNATEVDQHGYYGVMVYYDDDTNELMARNEKLTIIA